MDPERLIGGQLAFGHRLASDVPVREVDRLEWRAGDPGNPTDLLEGFLAEHVHADGSVALLLGARGCARLAGLPEGRSSPVPVVPELVAVARRPASVSAGVVAPPVVGEWSTSWTDAEHAAAVEAVRRAIARGDVYQANVVGHRSAPHLSDPRDLAAAVAALPGASYSGVLAGEGWAVGCGSPEQLVRVVGDRITTVPIKGTARIAPGSDSALRASAKDRAEHVMIVDLERNDLSRVCRTGSVRVEELYALYEWSGLWQASSTVAGRLEDGVTTMDVLRALLPGGSVTGAPKRAACALLADLEPVGRGPSMGALGVVTTDGMDLGLTIRTVAADADRVHLWAGGGITWSSDPAAEVEEAHAKAGPVVRALSSP